MLQQRFLITLFFLLRFSYKIFLFFVQFSVHFLFFTCFFYYKKILHLFHFYCFSPSHALDFVFFFLVFIFGANFQPWSPSRDSSTRVCKPAKTWLRLAGSRTGCSPNTGRWGFVVCVCLCVCVDVWFFCLFECMLFSLHLYTYVTFL